MSSEAWRKLEEAALAHQRGNLETAKPLAEAAEAFARARQGAPAKPSGGASGVVVPFGRSKGTPIEQADRRDLQWVAARLAESLDNPEKARWRDENSRVLEEINRVIRGGP